MKMWYDYQWDNSPHDYFVFLFLHDFPQVDTELLPVLLFIHGGSNVVGMGAMLDGDILAAHEEIIVISFNYRLDVLGKFFCFSVKISSILYKI